MLNDQYKTLARTVFLYFTKNKKIFIKLTLNMTTPVVTAIKIIMHTARAMSS